MHLGTYSDDSAYFFFAMSQAAVLTLNKTRLFWILFLFKTKINNGKITIK